MNYEKKKFHQIMTIKKGEAITKAEANEGCYPVILGGKEPAYYIDRYNHEGKAIVISRSGASAGYASFWNERIFVTDGFLVEPLHNNDFEFIYYLLKSFEKPLRDLQNGSAIPHVTPKTIYSLKASIPPISIQKRIATLLISYDSLIDINNKRIKMLEQMAENLYKEWFVRFRFPGHETAEFENGLPKGWERNRISQYYFTSSGGTPSRDNEDYYENGTIPWIKTGEMQDCLLIDTEEHITEEAIKKSSAKLFPKDSVLMAMYGVNIGMLAYSTMKATCNQACCVFKDKGSINTKHYLFQYLKSIREYLLLIAFGAAQQNLSQDLIKQVKILRPDNDTIIYFENAIELLYQETKKLLAQNSNLVKQRDLLLPRLMSGKLEG